jgi:hypothetical protein
MEETMCDYSLESYRSRPARLGERYETRQFQSRSIGFIAPGDPSTAVYMACDTKLRLEGIPEMAQRVHGVSANENVTFTRLDNGPHHDRARFANGAEMTLQELGPGVKPGRTGRYRVLTTPKDWRVRRHSDFADFLVRQGRRPRTDRQHATSHSLTCVWQ